MYTSLFYPVQLEDSHPWADSCYMEFELPRWVTDNTLGYEIEALQKRLELQELQLIPGTITHRPSINEGMLLARCQASHLLYQITQYEQDFKEQDDMVHHERYRFSAVVTRQRFGVGREGLEEALLQGLEGPYAKPIAYYIEEDKDLKWLNIVLIRSDVAEWWMLYQPSIHYGYNFDHELTFNDHPLLDCITQNPLPMKK